REVLAGYPGEGDEVASGLVARPGPARRFESGCRLQMWRSAVGSKRPSPPPKEQPIAASRKKRKRPTRLRVKDDQALAALVQFGIYHHAAIADHLLKRFEDAKQPGDRLSIGAEAFFCMIAAVEDLEMLYFAMKEKVVNPKPSFFAEYAGMFI